MIRVVLKDRDSEALREPPGVPEAEVPEFRATPGNVQLSARSRPLTEGAAAPCVVWRALSGTLAAYHRFSKGTVLCLQYDSWLLIEPLKARKVRKCICFFIK